MRILIVEDEILAKEKLESHLSELIPDVEILAHLESVTETVNWLRENPSPDVAFFDIQLSDATCFEIFEQIKIQFPVIFLTAFDDYVMKALDNNAIHYILKPVSRKKLSETFTKLQDFREHFMTIGIRNLIGSSNSNKSNWTRLIVKKGLDAIPLSIKEVAYFFSEHKISFVKSKANISYMVDHSITELQHNLDPHAFFRANRKYLISIDAIENFRSTDSSKILVKLTPSSQTISISKENAVHFRKWIKGNQAE